MWKKILATVFIAFFILLTIEKISEYFFKRYPVLKSSYISQVKQDADIVIHGSCEAEMIINPSYFDSSTNFKTFNLGELGSRYPDNYLMLHLYLKNQKKPKYLILHVSPESFEFSLLLVFGFVAAVIGGIESLVGAVLGGLTLGIILAIILMYVGGSLVFIAAFLILILVLLLRPQGIIGAKGGRRA